MEAALIARVGAFVFAGVLGVPAALPASGAPLSVAAEVVDAPAAVALGVAIDLSAETRALAPGARRAGELSRSRVARAADGGAVALASVDEAAPASSQTSVAAEASGPVAVPPPTPYLGPAPTGGLVLASWYGPGFYGNRTACGVTLTPATLGVAHRTLPCGSLVTLTSFAGRTVTVPVVDRGPYVAGRTLDLTAATKIALACTDLCHLQMAVP